MNGLKSWCDQAPPRGLGSKKNYAEVWILKSQKHKFTTKKAEIMSFWIFEKCLLAPSRDFGSKNMSIFEFPRFKIIWNNNKK